MNIATLIFDLLQTHDCVIVPGLGGFLGQNQSAAFDATGNLFPPKRVLSFNARLNGNDGLLVHSLSSKLEIGFANAQKKVHQFVETAYTLLNQNEAVHFDKVGSLNFDENGNLQFVQYKDQEVFSDYFGLKPIAPLPVEREKPEESIIKEAKVIPISKEKPHKKFAIVARYAAAAVLTLAVVLSGVIGFISYENNKVADTASLSPIMDSSHEVQQEIFKPETTILEDTIATVTTNGNVETETLNEVITTENEVQVPAESVEIKHGYYIVVGAFSKEENADALYYQLQTELDGSTTVAKFPRNGLTAVGFYTSPNSNEAAAMLAKAKQKDAAVWLLKM